MRRLLSRRARGGPTPRTPQCTVAYGPHPDQCADLWLPPGPGPHRLVVSVHGGYFRSEYRRDLHEPIARALVRAGVAVLNIEYRRTGTGGSLEETTADILAAVSMISGSAAGRPGGGSARALPELGSEVAVVGHSAGGYLALWAARHPAVGLVVALAPVTDLVGIVAGGHDRGGVTAWMRGGPADDPDRYRAGDLTGSLPTRTATVLVHGTADDVVPPEQSIRYHEQATAAGDPCQLLLLPGQGHFGLIRPRTAAFAAWLAPVVDWAAR